MKLLLVQIDEEAQKLRNTSEDTVLFEYDLLKHT